MRRAKVSSCLFLVAALLFLPARHADAWWQTGHHVIAVLAYELLPPEDREELLEILKSHPRFAEDFTAPENIQGDPESIARWQIGCAGYWPDVARDHDEWNRPNWHYQLGSTLVLGKRSDVEVPKNPGPLPKDADLETRELYIAQAIELCKSVLADKTRSNQDRALAICWLCHLVGDSHQPCHAGSLYAAKVLPDGDRGANSIPVKGKRNMHAIWDSLLGDNATPNNVRKRVLEIMDNDELMASAKEQGKDLNVETWLSESRTYAKQYVYVPEVIRSVQVGMRGLTEEVEPVALEEEYFTKAGSIAQERGALAGVRLQHILHEALESARTAN